MNLKKTALIICFVIFLITVRGSQSQNWLPLDKGIGHPYATIYHLLPDSNFIYISGSFTEDGNKIPMRGISKWNGIKWDSVGDANKFNGTKGGIYKYHDTLMTSSIFYDMWHVNFAKLNGSIWDTLPNTDDLAVNCFVEKDGILYMGGGFFKCGNDSTFLLGKYDGTSFSGMTPLYNNHTSGYAVSCMAFFQDTLYIGGLFYLYPQFPIACFAKWDGYNIIPVSMQFNNTTCIIETMTLYKNELYIGGEFYKVNGFTGDCIMKWDGHQFSEVGDGTNQRVTCMKVYNNELYVGGWFTEVGGSSCKNIAKWDGQQWTCLNDEEFDEFYCLRDICIINDELYVGGSFRKIGNDSISSIAKYNHPLNSIQEHHGTLTANYPNPFTEYTTLIFSKQLNEATLQVYDIIGKEVMRMENLNGKEIRISRNGISKGMYFFRVVEGNINVGKGKMIVE
ncbi:MAG: T9SS type A sorting domain-containing protein [Bacteroidales bacterium]|nr:T9SS type A sorting domain-containing protein [Bacteroidales bacterium]MDD4213704.1 T9SS type A sorting domain-containing protein [Bacteroidales bacterium]